MIVDSPPNRLSSEMARALDQLRIQLDELLSRMPSSNLEARRLITRELHYEPRPEELQTIVRIAEDESEAGPCYELPRELLRTRLFVDRELRRMLDMKPLDAEALDTCAQTLSQLQDEVARLEMELGTFVDADKIISKKDREYILQMGSALSCSTDEMIACSTLASQMATMTRAEERDDLESETATLSSEQRNRFRSLMDPIAADRSSRTTIDAMAIHSHIDGLLADWMKLGKPSDDNESFRTIRDLLVERFQVAHGALEFVAARLQKQQDEALQAGSSGLAEELRDSSRDLFSVKLRLAPVLRDPYQDVEQQDPSMLSMLRESAAEEVALPDAPRKVSEEELYVGALKDLRTRKTTVEYKSTRNRRSEIALQRRRMRILGAVAGLFIDFVRDRQRLRTGSVSAGTGGAAHS